jgi:hypothetical protein
MRGNHPRAGAHHIILAMERWWRWTEKAVCNCGKGLMVVDGNPTRFLQLGEMEKEVRRQPIRSKEDKGTREVELIEVGQCGNALIKFGEGE